MSLASGAEALLALTFAIVGTSCLYLARKRLKSDPECAAAQFFLGNSGVWILRLVFAFAIVLSLYHLFMSASFGMLGGPPGPPPDAAGPPMNISGPPPGGAPGPGGWTGHLTLLVFAAYAITFALMARLVGKGRKKA
jgi:hypothetical protein